MKPNDMYQDLQDCFIKIRHFSSAYNLDYSLYEETIEKIKIYETRCIKHVT